MTRPSGLIDVCQGVAELLQVKLNANGAIPQPENDLSSVWLHVHS